MNWVVSLAKNLNSGTNINATYLNSFQILSCLKGKGKI
jgi:hypothetical protein